MNAAYEKPSSPAVTDVERLVVRYLFWVLPVLMAVLVPILAGGLWTLIGLDPTIYQLPSPTRIAIYAAVGFGAGLVFCGLWLVSITMSGWRFSSWRISILVAVLVVPVVDVAARHPRFIDAVWSAVRVRTHWHGDFFLREAALFNRMSLTNDRPVERPRLQIFGSSQLIMGVDYDLLQELRPDLQVERRCIAGMNPSRMLMAYPLLGTRAGDTILVYWSEFDMGGMTHLDADWFRPVGNPDGFEALYAEFPRIDFYRQYKQAVDVLFASYSKLWSMRDGLRLIISRKTGMISLATRGKVEPRDQMGGQAAGYEAGLNNDAYFTMGLRSAEYLIEYWHRMGARVIVLEGDVSPEIRTEASDLKKRVTRDFLANAAARHGATYIPMDADGFIPQTDEWRDGTHLNEVGAQRFTLYLSRLK